MNIRIYNPLTLELNYIIPNMENLQITKKFYAPGTFDMTIPFKSKHLKYIRQGNIISAADMVGKIEYVNFTSNGIVIKGNDLKGLAKQRQVVPPFVGKENPEVIDGYDRIKGNGETVLLHYVDSQMINPTDESRKFPFLVASENQNRGLESMAWQAKFTELHTTLEEIGRYTELGYDIVFDKETKQLIFYVLSGTDRTASQNHNPPVVFCEKYRSINDYDYTYDALGSANVLYAGGDGEEEQQYVEKVYTDLPTGIERYEAYDDFSSEDMDEFTTKTESALKELACSETISCEVSGKYKYKKDWFLGDYVTVKIPADNGYMIIDKQITEVNEVYDKSGVTVSPILGDVKNPIIKFLKG